MKCATIGADIIHYWLLATLLKISFPNIIVDNKDSLRWIDFTFWNSENALIFYFSKFSGSKVNLVGPSFLGGVGYNSKNNNRKDMTF